MCIRDRLEHAQQVLTRDARGPAGLDVEVVELLLEQSVDTACLLLLAQLAEVLRPLALSLIHIYGGRRASRGRWSGGLRPGPDRDGRQRSGSVPHRHQRQALGWSGLGGLAAVGRPQDVEHVRGALASPAHVDKGPDQRADHLVAEGVGLDLEGEEVPHDRCQPCLLYTSSRPRW